MRVLHMKFTKTGTPRENYLEEVMGAFQFGGKDVRK
jgi:hypothetical protein